MTTEREPLKVKVHVPPPPPRKIVADPAAEARLANSGPLPIYNENDFLVFDDDEDKKKPEVVTFYDSSSDDLRMVRGLLGTILVVLILIGLMVLGILVSI